MSRDDGGPAFPVTSPDGDVFSGLSLRDWFAGMAMQAIINQSYGASDDSWDALASDSYDAADAMLRAREEQAEKEHRPEPYV